MSQPVQIAIIGSGPSGFYAAEALLRTDLAVHIDMFERLPTPFGLVRSGVAPDHQKLKQPIQVFERIARSPNFNFLGNVALGTDITVDELRSAYHAVIFACGAQQDRRMSIPGEDLSGSHTATEFIGWYNGHPDYRDRTFDLQQEVVAVIGQGNVAADVCRILTRPVDELRFTDIAEHALDELSQSTIRDVYVIGRRGPAQAKFTPKELRELTGLTNVVATITPGQLELGDVCRAELANHSNAAAPRNLEVFRSIAGNTRRPGHRSIHFRFLASPHALHGRVRVERLSFVHNRLVGEAFNQRAVATDQIEDLDCGLVFRSIGYRGSPIAGLPFDEEKGVLPNTAGLLKEGDRSLPGLYVTGWLKRGPSGIIGTNRADSIETVETLLADLAAAGVGSAPGLTCLRPLIEKRCQPVVGLSDWFDIDGAEVRLGKTKGKPREKFTRIDEMLNVLSRS